MFIISDRVKETSSTTGIGDLVLNGAYGSFQTFNTGIGDGNTTYYTIENNSRWEVGQGVYTASSNSISRDVVFDSSAGGSKISLEGVSTVFCTLPASRAFIEDPDGGVRVVDIVSTRDGNIKDLKVDTIFVSGDSNLQGSLSVNGDTVMGGNTLVSGDLSLLGDLDLNLDGDINADEVTAKFLTLVRPNSSGNFFHAYKDDGTNQTVSLWVDASVSPLWRLGLKTNPLDQTATPTFGYIFGRDGSVGSVSDTNNYFSIANTLGFSVQHQGNLVFRASSDTGVYIDSQSALYPALTVQGAVLNTSDLQRWENSLGVSLSVVDSGGKIGVLTDTPIYELDVNGSGRMETITLTSGVYFQDGTFQSSAFTGADASAVSGWAAETITNGDNAVSGWAASTFLTSDDDSIANFASGLAVQNELDIVTVSGLLGDSEVANFASGLAVQNETDIATVSGLLYNDASLSGYFESRVDTNEAQTAAVSGWAGSTITNEIASLVDSAPATLNTLNELAAAINDDAGFSTFISNSISANSVSGVAISGIANFASGLAVQNETDIATVSGLLYDDAAISGYFETRVDTADSQISSVSGWAASTFLTSDDDSIANFASGLAVQNEIEISSVSGYFETRSDTNATDIVTVSGLLSSAGSTSGIVFEKSGSNDEYRIGTTFIDADGTEQVVRATDFDGGYLRLEVARFSPSVSAAGQSRSWDQAVTQWTVTVDNPTDFLTNYVSGVKSPLTGITGGVTSDVTLYSTSGPSVTPGGGVDWTQTFSTDGDSPIYSSTNNLTGGSASATVSFLDKNQATISETATITFNWSNASNGISFGNLSGKNFLETYTSTTYNLTINNISDLSNTSTTITSSQGSLSNSSDDGTITFTTPIHKNNNSGRTITATTDFTRPATVTGTEYTSQDVSSDSSISASFTYPSFYIFTASTSNVPSRADVVDTNDFDSSTVTELGNQVKAIDQYINNPDGVPKCWWFGVRSSASQPTSFETGSGPSLLVGATPTEATVDLEPDSPPAGYSSEEYKLYGITLNPGNTYVKIS
tara:strand:- start:343 stop:3465 length:3123 start_codon:yes stop_codon:yes gene_type:complete